MATTEYHRVAIEDAPDFRAAGWTFASGWFPFQQSWWAWFSRPVADRD